MRARSTSGVAVAILVMGITSGGNAASFQFTAIDVPGASLIQPEGLNDDGQIVGAFTQNSTNDGFLLNNGHLTTINVPNAFTAALGINALGQIVGYYDARGSSRCPRLINI